MSIADITAPRMAADRPARLAPAGPAGPDVPDLAGLPAEQAGNDRPWHRSCCWSLSPSSPTSIAPYDPLVGGDLRTARLLPPSWAHLMGTDDQARDIFSRVVYGSRLTLMVVALVAIIATPIGLLVGTTAGYFGGWVDTVLMRITDIFLAFPRLILALAFVAALGPGIENAIIAIAITSWPPYARLARAETLTIRDTDYIAAIRLQGASSARIISGHVVPLVPVVGDHPGDARHGRVSS